MFLKAVDSTTLPQTSGLMTRKGNLETALAFETKLALKTKKLEKSALETTAHLTPAVETIAQETIALEMTTRKTTAQERQIQMANTHWCSTSSTLWHHNAAVRLPEDFLFMKS